MVSKKQSSYTETLAFKCHGTLNGGFILYLEAEHYQELGEGVNWELIAEYRVSVRGDKKCWKWWRCLHSIMNIMSLNCTL